MRKGNRWKGCCMMCAAWIRGDGKTKRMKSGDLRRAGKKVTKYKKWKQGEDD